MPGSADGGNFPDVATRTLEDKLRCVQCLEFFDADARKPRFLRCLHSVCESCAGALLLESNVLLCNLCGAKTDVSGVNVCALKANEDLRALVLFLTPVGGRIDDTDVAKCLCLSRRLINDGSFLRSGRAAPSAFAVGAAPQPSAAAAHAVVPTSTPIPPTSPAPSLKPRVVALADAKKAEVGQGVAAVPDVNRDAFALDSRPRITASGRNAALSAFMVFPTAGEHSALKIDPVLISCGDAGRIDPLEKPANPGSLEMNGENHLRPGAMTGFGGNLWNARVPERRDISGSSDVDDGNRRKPNTLLGIGQKSVEAYETVPNKREPTRKKESVVCPVPAGSSRSPAVRCDDSGRGGRSSHVETRCSASHRSEIGEFRSGSRNSEKDRERSRSSAVPSAQNAAAVGGARPKSRQPNAAQVASGVSSDGGAPACRPEPSGGGGGDRNKSRPNPVLDGVALLGSSLRRAERERSESCPVCLRRLEGGKPSPFSDGHLDEWALVRLMCGQALHHHCAVHVYSGLHKGDRSFDCPRCGETHGKCRGDQPDAGETKAALRNGSQPDGGKMVVTVRPSADFLSEHPSIPGFPYTDTIVIRYEFESGIQGPNHPFLGEPYKAEHFPREAFLPFTKEGYEVLCMLKVAFDRRLVFKIGSKPANPKSQQLLWAGIPHKTTLGEGPCGYPDPGYLVALKKKLQDLGITPSDIPGGMALDIPYGCASSTRKLLPDASWSCAS